MAIGDTNITVVGNMVADPELRFTPSGAAVCNFRMASTPRSFNRQTNQWEDGEPMFLTVNVWRQAAENVAESLSKGMRVIVQGRLKQSSYETREGEKRSVFEVEADEVGPSLTFAYANVHRQTSSTAGRQSNSQQGSTTHQGGFSGSQGGFSRNQSTPQTAPDNDPWNSAPAATGGFGGSDDQPPF